MSTIEFFYILYVIKYDTDVFPTYRRHVVVGQTPIRLAEFGENAEISQDVIAYDVNFIGEHRQISLGKSWLYSVKYLVFCREIRIVERLSCTELVLKIHSPVALFSV